MLKLIAELSESVDWFMWCEVRERWCERDAEVVDGFMTGKGDSAGRRSRRGHEQGDQRSENCRRRRTWLEKDVKPAPNLLLVRVDGGLPRLVDDFDLVERLRGRREKAELVRSAGDGEE